MSRKDRFRKIVLIFTLIAAVVLLNACGGSSPRNGNAGNDKEKTNQTGEQSNKTDKTETTGQGKNADPITYSGADREQRLIEGAKKEGAMTWYTTLAGPVVNAMTQKFQEKYPFIKVEVFRGDQANIVSRLNTERQGNKNAADVLEVTSDSALLLRENGFLTPYFSPSANRVPEQYRVKTKESLFWEATDRVSYISFAYNKSKLPSTSVPKTLPDLLKPEMKGKIALVSSTTGIRFVGGVLTALGEEEGQKFLKKLAEQNVRIESVSGAALMGLIAQGEVAASPTIFQNHTEQQAAKGAPVEWVPVSPVIANAGDVVVMKTVPHPHSAMLFVDFILGEEGGKVLKGLQYSTPSDKVDFKYWLPEEGLEFSKEYEAAYKKWQNIFKSTFR